MIRVPNASNIPDNIILDGQEYSTTKNIKYLGVNLTSTLNRPATVKQRCVSTAKAAKLIVKFCSKFKPDWEIGKLIYKTVIAPSLLYGAKVSTLTKRSRVQLAKYEKMIMKDIWNNCKKDNSRKFNVKRELDGKTVNRRARVGRLDYTGHISRREPDHPLRLAYEFDLGKKRR